MLNGIKLTAFDAAAILIVLAAALGYYLNFRFLKLPPSIGMAIMGTLACLIVVAIDRVVSWFPCRQRMSGFVGGSLLNTKRHLNWCGSPYEELALS